MAIRRILDLPNGELLASADNQETQTSTLIKFDRYMDAAELVQTER